MTRLIQSNPLISGEKCVHSASPLEGQTDHLHHIPVGNLSVTGLLFSQVLTHLLGTLLNVAMSIALQQRILFCPWRTAMLLWKLAYGRTSKHSFSSLLGLGCQKYIFLHILEEEIMLGVRLLQEVSSRGLNKAQISWCWSISSESCVFMLEMAKWWPRFCRTLETFSTASGKWSRHLSDVRPQGKPEHFPFPVLLHIGYRVSHLGVNRRHDFECQD